MLRYPFPSLTPQGRSVKALVSPPLPEEGIMVKGKKEYDVSALMHGIGFVII